MSSSRLTRLVEELQQVAEKLGIKVSYEQMTDICAGKGGLCKVKGNFRIIVDRRTTIEERVGYLVEALADFDLENQYLSPHARELLALQRGEPIDVPIDSPSLQQTA